MNCRSQCLWLFVIYQCCYLLADGTPLSHSLKMLHANCSSVFRRWKTSCRRKAAAAAVRSILTSSGPPRTWARSPATTPWPESSREATRGSERRWRYLLEQNLLLKVLSLVGSSSFLVRLVGFLEQVDGKLFILKLSKWGLNSLKLKVFPCYAIDAVNPVTKEHFTVSNLNDPVPSRVPNKSSLNFADMLQPISRIMI